VATDVGDSSAGLVTSDDFVENADTGVTLSVTQAGDTVSLNYVSQNLGLNATINYSITYLV
jgi:hypothetical protein